VKKVSTGRGSFLQPYACELTSASVNYHDDTDSQDYNGFQGVDLEVANRTSGTYVMASGEN